MTVMLKQLKDYDKLWCGGKLRVGRLAGLEGTRGVLEKCVVSPQLCCEPKTIICLQPLKE